MSADSSPRSDSLASGDRSSRATGYSRVEWPDLLHGDHPAIQDLRAQIPRIASSPAPVLVEGESGTGKSELARAIHRWSPRANRPIQVIDCAAIPETMFVSELFGASAGAYTGADRDRPGRLAAANGSSVLFHGIDELSRANQAALLRVLEEREFVPLGAVRGTRLDVRFLQTTRVPASELVRAGRLRSDLYHRLNTLTLRLPPLRERRDDLRNLLAEWIRQEAAQLGEAPPVLEAELTQLLCLYDWPGNLRELRHTLRGMLAVAERRRLTPDDLPRLLRERLRPAPRTETYSIPGHLAFHVQVETFERTVLRRAWRTHSGHRARMAEALGLAPHQLKYLLKKHAIADDDRG